MKHPHSTSAELLVGGSRAFRSRYQARTCIGVAALLGFALAGCAKGDASGAAGTGAAAGTGVVAGVGTAGSAVTAGNAAGGTGAAAGTGSAGAATFTAVLAVLGPDGGNCGVCHASKASTTNGGFMFNSTDKAGTLAAFVGKMSPGTSGSKCGGKTYVVAGNPSGSLLYQKINASPPCGARMPQGLAPLSDAQIATIGAWIMAGAKND